MDQNGFQKLLWQGLGRAILYARDNDVQPFRDVILDACLHCHAVDPTCEATRADYMFEFVSVLPDRQYYCDAILESLPESGDDWDARQRFRFATNMVFDGQERAKQEMYKTFRPGPRMGEGIALNFLQLDGLNGLLFAAEKIGELLISKPAEAVDVGWLCSEAIETFGEDEVESVLNKAGAADPRVAAYRSISKGFGKGPGKESWEEIKALKYEQLKPRLAALRGFRVTGWGRSASAEDLERAAHGLVAARTPEEQIQHLKIFGDARFHWMRTSL